MSPRRVLHEHSSAELSEWAAFDRAIGLSYSGDVQAGIIAASLWNSQGGYPEDDSGSGRRPATIGDFFPHLGDAEQQRERVHGATHGEVDEPEVDEPEVDDDGLTEAERATLAMKNAWALWGLQQNAALRAAEKLDAGEPPDEPELN